MGFGVFIHRSDSIYDDSPALRSCRGGRFHRNSHSATHARNDGKFLSDCPGTQNDWAAPLYCFREASHSGSSAALLRELLRACRGAENIVGIIVYFVCGLPQLKGNDAAPWSNRRPLSQPPFGAQILSLEGCSFGLERPGTRPDVVERAAGAAVGKSPFGVAAAGFCVPACIRTIDAVLFELLCAGCYRQVRLLPSG